MKAYLKNEVVNVQVDEERVKIEVQNERVEAQLDFTWEEFASLASSIGDRIDAVTMGRHTVLPKVPTLLSIGEKPRENN